MNEFRLVKCYLTDAARFCRRCYRHALYRLRGTLQDTVTMRTKQGLLTVSTQENRNGIGACLYREKQYEYDASVRAIEFLKTAGFIPASDVSMLDVGASIGCISIGLILANQVTRAVAIEPEPHNFMLLSKNVEQNGLSERMGCLQIAVGDKASTLDMELSPNNFSDHRIREVTASDVSERWQESERRTIQVKSYPLPEILKFPEVRKLELSSPSLLWIDVQGYEGYVFKGARGMLKEGLPTVSEIWPYGILRAGMTLAEFAGIAGTIWSDYWIERRDRFVRYPITVFDRYLDELGPDGHFENVIFTGRSV